jgi:hypothetical protein
MTVIDFCKVYTYLESLLHILYQKPKEETPMTTTLKQKYQDSINERKATLQGMICSERDKAIADKLEEAKTDGQK